MINFKLPDEVLKVFNKLKKAGYEIYLVGGSVRNLLLGKKTTNWDFTTNATPHEILKIFKEGFYNNQFGTVGVPQKSGLIFEITTFRSEKGYTDKRHPDQIRWGKTLIEDLSRRDFTINALAFDGKQIIDPYQGQKDLQAKVIKTVGEPQARFNEDALRLLRAVRIAAELGFMIEEKTLAAIKKYRKNIHVISAERIREEIFKILASPYPADGFFLLRSTGLLKEILPELDACFGVAQKSPKRHHVYDVGTHLVMSLKFCKAKDPIVRLATLLHDVGKPKVVSKNQDNIITFYNHEIVGTKIVEEIAKKLKLAKKDSQKLITLVRWHQFSVDERQTDKALRRFIRRVGKENLEDMLALRIADRLGGGAKETSWRLELFKKRLQEVQKQPFTVADLKIDGYDVMKILNIKPGPRVGEILNHLFQKVEEGKLPNKREILLEEIKNISLKDN